MRINLIIWLLGLVLQTLLKHVQRVLLAYGYHLLSFGVNLQVRSRVFLVQRVNALFLLKAPRAPRRG